MPRDGKEIFFGEIKDGFAITKRDFIALPFNRELVEFVHGIAIGRHAEVFPLGR